MKSCVAVFGLAVLAACGSEVRSTDGGATPRDAAVLPDANTPDATVTDARAADVGPQGDAGTHEAYGFSVRVPQRRLVPCAGGNGCSAPMQEASDVDFVCTLSHGARTEQRVYVQNRPLRYDPGLGLAPLPVYTTDGAFLSDGTRELQRAFSAVYDYGGGHHNDTLSIDLGPDVYRYSHSSFGFGFRRCQEMDCLQVFAAGGATPTEDGCTRDRTLPIVCVRVAEDGTVPALDDTFMRCPGDGG